MIQVIAIGVVLRPRRAERRNRNPMASPSDQSFVTQELPELYGRRTCFMVNGKRTTSIPPHPEALAVEVGVPEKNHAKPAYIQPRFTHQQQNTPA